MIGMKRGGVGEGRVLPEGNILEIGMIAKIAENYGFGNWVSLYIGKRNRTHGVVAVL
jgi:hypothetical protein